MKRIGSIVAMALVVGSILVGCTRLEKEDTAEAFCLVVHGGAGTILRENMTPELETQYKDALTEALQQGYAVLSEGGSALDAVERAVHVLEDSPLFNAGKGAVFTNQGRNELDASIMDGSTLNAGAVASVTTIKNPITAARRVMENSRHVMLVGQGAELFASENGCEIVDPKYFFVQRRWDALLKAKQKEQSSTRTRDDLKYGTAAAVALDRQGNLAAGTSTGGLTNKLYGRVGDSPIIGAGTYANNKTCAVSGTGQGEYFMRGLTTYDVSALMEYTALSLQQAADRVIHGKLTTLGGEGGIIAVDKAGNVAMEFNTPGMYRGYVKTDGKFYVAIYGDE